MTTTKSQADKQKTEIEKQITGKGLTFYFLSMSETNYGLSIYYEIEGRKCRFSNHTVTNLHRMTEEFHFDLPFKSVMGIGGVKKHEYCNNNLRFKEYFNK